MMKLRFLALVLLLSALASWPCLAAQPIDRLVASVNGKVILQSDWDQAVCYQALVDGRDPATFSPDEKQAALSRLVDQELLRQQMNGSSFDHATAEDANKQVGEIEQRNPRDMDRLLARCGMTGEELRQHAMLQINVMRLVESRLRPAVHVDAQSIEEYYHDQFLPELLKAGSEPPPLSQVSPRIKEVLTQEKINQALTTWLAGLRSNSTIQTSGEGIPRIQAE